MRHIRGELNGGVGGAEKNAAGEKYIFRHTREFYGQNCQYFRVCPLAIKSAIKLEIRFAKHTHKNSSNGSKTSTK